MEIIAIILSSLALLAALLNTILILVEKKRSEKSRATMIGYVNNECKALHDNAVRKATEKIEEVKDAVNDQIASVRTDYKKAIEEVALDYREAQNAASHINDFARGLSNIFDYDPLRSARKSRDGREVE